MIKRAWYVTLRFCVKMAIMLFYRRIEIHGSEDFPATGAILLAPNHQNAFMDALIPAVFAPRSIHFLVRADVFKKGFADKFLRSLNMMPVYRQRDGKENLQKNEEVFEECFDILRNEGTLLIFPEASHLGERRLRNLSKGFTRIVFGALEDHINLELQVLPLGLNYSNYYDSQSLLLINFGKPINASDYLAEYLENPAKAMTRLRTDLQASLVNQIIHIENPHAQRAFDVEMERILPFYLHRASGFTKTDFNLDFYRKRSQYIDTLPEESTYVEKLLIYDGTMSKHNLHAPLFYIAERDSGYWLIQSIFLAVFSPIFCLAWLMQSPSYLLIQYILKRYVKDKQFYSSIKLVGGLFLFPIFGILYGTLTAIISPRPVFGVAAILIFYVMSVLIIRELRLPYRYLITAIRLAFMRRRNKSLHGYIRELEYRFLADIKQ